MMALANAVVRHLDATAPLEIQSAIQNAIQYTHTKGSLGYPYVPKADYDKALSDYSLASQVAIPESGPKTLLSFFLQFRPSGQISALDDACNALRVLGEYAIADRIAYFASDEDLEEGDVPLTLESARGFLSFFEAVKSEGRISLTCSPEGWLCAVWRFADERRASLWFLDSHRVMFSAIDAAGNFIEIDGGSEVGGSRQIMAKLVETGLFTWNLDKMIGKNSTTTTMLPDIVVNEILAKMGRQRMMRFYSGLPVMNATFPQTGWSILIHQTDDSSSTASSGHYGENSL